MNIFRIFLKNRILFRCNYCNAAVRVPIKIVYQLENENRQDSVCPIKIECHYCHMGFVIPVYFKSKNGKIYKFDEIASKIPHLDPNTLLDRLFDEDNF